MSFTCVYPMTTALQVRSTALSFVTLAASGYAVVVVIASLVPFSGWRMPDTETLWALLLAWPRYFSQADMFLNVLGYLPLGWLVTQGLHPRMGSLRATGTSVMLSAILSLTLEILQSSLASRVTSGLDILCNIAGGMIGAVFGIIAFGFFHNHSELAAWRERVIVSGRLGDAALLTTVLWLLLACRSDVWLYTIGDLRPGISIGLIDYSANVYAAAEFGVTTVGLLSIAAFLRSFTVASTPREFLTLALATLLIRSLISLLLFDQRDPLLWLTPGNGLGVIVGVIVGYLGSHLDPRAAMRTTLAAMGTAVVLINIAPENPYLAPWPVAGWSQPHLRNLSATSHIIGVVWPLLAVVLVSTHGRMARLTSQADNSSRRSPAEDPVQSRKRLPS